MKIKLVFLREFMQRIKSKGFILSTLLAPFGMVIFLGLTIYSVSLGMEEESTQKIALNDKTGVVAPLLKLPDSRHTAVLLKPANRPPREPAPDQPCKSQNVGSLLTAEVSALPQQGIGRLPDLC